MRAFIPLVAFAVTAIICFYAFNYLATPKADRPELPLGVRLFGAVATILSIVGLILASAHLATTISGQM